MTARAQRLAAAGTALALALVCAPDRATAAPPIPGGPNHLTAQRDSALPDRTAPSARTTGRPFTAKAPSWPSGSAIELRGLPRARGRRFR